MLCAARRPSSICASSPLIFCVVDTRFTHPAQTSHSITSQCCVHFGYIPLQGLSPARTSLLDRWCLTHVLGSFDEASQCYVVECTTRTPAIRCLLAPHHHAFHASQCESLQVFFFMAPRCEHTTSCILHRQHPWEQFRSHQRTKLKLFVNIVMFLQFNTC